MSIPKALSNQTLKDVQAIVASMKRTGQSKPNEEESVILSRFVADTRMNQLYLDGILIGAVDIRVHNGDIEFKLSQKSVDQIREINSRDENGNVFSGMLSDMMFE